MATMNPFTSVWFWLLVLSIIAFIVAFILFETTGETNTDSTTTNPWVWILIAVGFALWIIALVIFAVSMANWHKCREIALACGEISPKEEKVIECPKAGGCVQTECHVNTPCGKKKVDCPPAQPCATPSAPPSTPVMVQAPPTRVMVAEQPRPATVAVINNSTSNMPPGTNFIGNLLSAPTANYVEGDAAPRVVVSNGAVQAPAPELGGNQAFAAAGLQPMAELPSEPLFAQI